MNVLLLWVFRLHGERPLATALATAIGDGDGDGDDCGDDDWTKIEAGDGDELRRR